MTEKSLERATYMKDFRARQRGEGVRRVSATLTPDEFERLSQSARKQGERLTTHLKSQALANLDRHYLVPPDIAARLDTVVAILRGIGNNLNQLARHSNEMRYFLDSQEVRLQLVHLEASVRDFIESPPVPPRPDPSHDH